MESSVDKSPDVTQLVVVKQGYRHNHFLHRFVSQDNLCLDVETADATLK